MEDEINLGQWLKEKRKEKKISLEKLGKAVDCSTQTIFNIEKGRGCSCRTLFKICQVLGYELVAVKKKEEEREE